MDALIKHLKKLKTSALIGLIGSVTVTLLWFILFSSKNVRTLGLSIFGAAVVIFVLKIVYDFVIEKMGVTKKFLANELFILFALIASDHYRFRSCGAVGGGVWQTGGP